LPPALLLKRNLKHILDFIDLSFKTIFSYPL